MIQFQHVSKAFGTQQVLCDASFTVRMGERVGVVGPNGAGKSTVFELLTSALEPDSGEVSVSSSLRVAHVRQQLHAHTCELSLLERTEDSVPGLAQIRARIHQLEDGLGVADEGTRRVLLRELGDLQTDFEHLGGYELRSRAEAILSGLGFPVPCFGQPFASFSGGWQIRAELARNLVSGPDILLLDEPTNYLDVPAIEWLREFLRSFRGTFLLISHDRYLLNSLTTVTLEVVGGKAARYAGNYDQYLEERRTRRAQLLAAKKNQDRKREQLERFVERFRAKNTKAAQAQSRQKMLDKLEPIHVPRTFVKPPPIRLPSPPRSGAEVMRIEDGGFSYDGQRWILEDIDLRIERGDKVAVVGHNGTGKTTLLRIMAGQLSLGKGRLRIGHNVEIGYQSQDFTHVMHPDHTVFETARGAAVDRSDGDIRALLGGFGFPGDAIEKRVMVLSGGEKVRLALVRLLLRPVNFLVLDEPTTHLDIHAREALESALGEYAGTICMVSHDIEFVRHLTTTVFAVGPDGVKRYYGDYDYYREKAAGDVLSDPSAHVREATGGGATGTDRKTRKRREARVRQELARLRKPLQQRIQAAEDLVERLEEEQAEIMRAMQSPAPGTDFEELGKRLAGIRLKLAQAGDEWECATLELEELERPASPT